MTIHSTTELVTVPAAAGVGAAIATVFSASEITAITVAIVALITAIFTGIANILTILRAERKVEQNTTVTNETLAETKVIAGHVNSSRTAAEAKIEALQQKLDTMQMQMAKQESIAALLAARASEPAPVTSDTHLKDIEQNTSETATNTKRTDDAVQDLQQKP